jgi:hypothetical protein
MKRSVVNDKNESFDISLSNIPFDVSQVIYEITTVSSFASCIEFSSVIRIKQCYESVDFLSGPFVKNLLLLSFHHIGSCYIRFDV